MVSQGSSRAVCEEELPSECQDVLLALNMSGTQAEHALENPKHCRIANMLHRRVYRSGNLALDRSTRLGSLGESGKRKGADNKRDGLSQTN